MSSEVKKSEPPTPSKPPTAEETQSRLIGDIVKTLMAEMLPGVAAAFAQGQPKSVPQLARGARDYGPVCHVCEQYLSACHGEHVEMAVFPVNYEEFAEFFRGVGINGKWYLSNDASHLIPVPKCAETHIKLTVRGFEQNERETRNGRKKSHNSGHIASPKPAEVGWR